MNNAEASLIYGVFGLIVVGLWVGALIGLAIIEIVEQIKWNREL
jgi:hypothetical protein